MNLTQNDELVYCFVFQENLNEDNNAILEDGSDSADLPQKLDNNEQEGLYWKTSAVHSATSWCKLQLAFGRHGHSTCKVCVF